MYGQLSTFPILNRKYQHAFEFMIDFDFAKRVNQGKPKRWVAKDGLQRATKVPRVRAQALQSQQALRVNIQAFHSNIVILDIDFHPVQEDSLAALKERFIVW